MQEIIFTSAKPTDEAAIRNLLQNAELPADDFSSYLSHFVVARQNGAFVGAIGLESYQEAGLLRSLVVAPDYRSQGVGIQLCQKIFARAQTLGLKELYLLTTTADKFFPKLGFSPTDRDSVPGSIRATAEFASICPATAVCMVKKLDAHF